MSSIRCNIRLNSEWLLSILLISSRHRKRPSHGWMLMNDIFEVRANLADYVRCGGSFAGWSSATHRRFSELSSLDPLDGPLVQHFSILLFFIFQGGSLKIAGCSFFVLDLCTFCTRLCRLFFFFCIYFLFF